MNEKKPNYIYFTFYFMQSRPNEDKKYSELANTFIREAEFAKFFEGKNKDLSSTEVKVDIANMGNDGERTICILKSCDKEQLKKLVDTIKEYIDTL